MNRIERKLYELISILSEKGNPALDKEINYKANDGTQKKIVARAALRLPQDHPAHKEAEKIVKQTQAAEPKQKTAEKPTEKKPAQKPAEKKPTAQPAGQPAQKAEPVKIAAADFRTDAERNAEKGPKPGVDMGKSFDKMKDKSSDSPNKKSKRVGDNTKVKGTNIKVKPKIHKIPHKFRKQVNTKLSELLGEVEVEEKRAESVVLKDMGLNSKDELTDKNKEEFKTRMKKENKPPNLNLCKVSIPGTNLYCGKNKGLKREEMPQFKGKPIAGKPAAGMQADPKTGLVDIEGMYRDHLKSKGIEISEPVEVAPESLKATQNELVGSQVVSMTKALDQNPQDEFITAPIYVTRDGYIVDGHHRWAAITGHNMKNPDRQIPMKVMVIDDDIENVIPDAINFADSQGIERMAGKTAGKDMDKGSNKPKKQPTAEKKNLSLAKLLTVKN